MDELTFNAERPPPPAREGRAGPRAMAALAAVLAVAGALVYAWSGAAMSGAARAPAPPAAAQTLTADDLREMADLPLVAARLKNRLRQTPDDANGWAMLARTYARLGRPAEAGDAFKRAVSLRADDADLLVDYADTLAFLGGRDLEGEPRRLIEQALRIDASHAAALLLAGLAAFDRRDDGAAIAYWEKLLAVVPADSQPAIQARQGIAEARRRAAAAGRR